MSHPKSAAQKRIEGTYRADRDAAKEGAERELVQKGLAIPAGSRLRCPRTIKTRAARAYWREVTSMLTSQHILIPADLPQIEEMCILMEKLKEAQAAFQEAEPLSEEYFPLMKACLALSKRFDQIASKYGVSPAARARLALDAARATSEAKAATSAIDSILNSRA